jgi:heme exporter protein A
LTKPLLELRQLSCERDQRPLFSNLNLSCDAGEAVQILGPNGSGKTTLLRTLAGLCREFRGQILWNGEHVDQVGWDYRHNILFIGHRPGIKTALTPLENLSWYSALTDRASTDTVATALAAVGLSGYEDIPCAQLSAGQLRRVALARLHLSGARLWILDEPFTAIDKSGVAELEALMARHTSKGGLVLLSSHQELALSGLRRIDLVDYPPKWLEPEERYSA